MKQFIGLIAIGLIVIGCEPSANCDGHSRHRPYCHNLYEEVPSDPQSISEGFKRYDSYKLNVSTNKRWRLVNCKFEKYSGRMYRMKIHYHEVPVENEWLDEHGIKKKNGNRRSISVCR